MSKRMAKLYEKAWNETVEGLSDYQKDIIINNFPYDNRVDKDVSDSVVRDAIRLAEQWERELKGDSKQNEYDDYWETTPAP